MGSTVAIYIGSSRATIMKNQPADTPFAQAPSAYTSMMDSRVAIQFTWNAEQGQSGIQAVSEIAKSGIDDRAAHGLELRGRHLSIIGLLDPTQLGTRDAPLVGRNSTAIASASCRSAMTIYFTSDQHFGDSAARSFYRRPFASVAEMDQQMIDRWNSVVSPGDGDDVWHLGDFAIRQSVQRVAHLLQTLHGRKHLIVGNNDGPAVTDCSGWQSVQHICGTHHRWKEARALPLPVPNLAGHKQGIDQPPRPQPRQAKAVAAPVRRRRGCVGFPARPVG